MGKNEDGDGGRCAQTGNYLYTVTNLSPARPSSLIASHHIASNRLAAHDESSSSSSWWRKGTFSQTMRSLASNRVSCHFLVSFTFSQYIFSTSSTSLFISLQHTEDTISFYLFFQHCKIAAQYKSCAAAEFITD
jgi:hypothetical protein